MKFLISVVLVMATISAEQPQLLRKFASGNIEYISSLYKELLQVHPGNFLISPLSIQTVFALVNAGAGGNTSKQITEALRLPEDEEKTKQVFLRLVENLQTNDKYTLSSANKVYVAENFKISKKFNNTAVDVFRSEIQNIDFGKAQEAAAEMNGWVEEATHDKIKNFLKTDSLSSDTVAVLINALYFQGKWVKEFADVERMPFRLSKKQSVLTNMMSMSDEFNYYKSPQLKAQFLELPYEGDTVTMTIVLPDDVEGFPALEDRIGDVLVTPLYTERWVDVFVPRFKIESTTHLIPVLRALGITDAFTLHANFTGIGENQDKLFISEAIQKAFIEVDEEGTTAAAASAVNIKIIGGYREEFVANHPFLFYLKHRLYGVFFIGRYSVAEEV